VVVAVLVDDELAASVLGVVAVSVDITGAVVVLAISACVEVAADWLVAGLLVAPVVVAESPLDIGAVEVAITAAVLVATVVPTVGDVVVALSADDSVTDSAGITASGSERAAY